MASFSVPATTIITNKPMIMSFPLLSRHSQTRCQLSSLTMKPNTNTHAAAKGTPQCLPSSTTQQPDRPYAKFPSDIWADRLAAFTFNQSELESCDRQVELLKKDMEAMLMAPTSDAVEKIVLIDLFCRLGVSYHFESEIEDQLHQIYTSQPNFLDAKSYDLYTVSLVFRIFRQHGLKMSSDVFKRFKDENDGKFKESLVNDAKGMLSLFEASQLSVHGEDILDEALSFATAHLRPLANPSNPYFADEIFNALKHPLHKGMPRAKAREYISFYESQASNETLLKFAKLDFNRVQLLHQKELGDILAWWKELNLGMKLPYARNRIVGLYFWSICTYFEPQYARARNFLTKILYLLNYMDDTYDTYGTFEELQIFTHSIYRWDRDILDQLPADYLKHLYGALLDLFDELDNQAVKEGRSYAVSTTKDLVKKLARGYIIERQWTKDNYAPTFEESLKQSAMNTSGVHLLTAASFIGMGEVAGIEANRWLQNEPVPSIIRAAEIIGRLSDDTATYKDDEERGYVASPFFSYMKQYKMSEMEVIEEFRKIISKEWKTINEEWMKRPTPVARVLLTRVVNFARIAQIMYTHGDGLTYAKHLEEYIRGLFIDRVPINN